MKVFAIVVSVVVCVAVILSFTLLPRVLGNVQLIDTNFTFSYAIIYRADGEQLVKIKSWKDYKNSDQIQIISEDDIVYLLHSSKVILLSDLEKN